MTYFQVTRGFFKSASLGVFALFLAGCSTDFSHIETAPTYVNSELREAGELPPYLINVGDILEVKFLYNEEFNQEIIVRPDGKISTAAIPSIIVAGRTPEDVTLELTEKYKDHLREPNLSLLVKSFSPTRIYVLGEVNNPGEYTALKNNPTLAQILSRAGDVLPSAKADQILIVRKNDIEQPTFYLAKYSDLTEGIDPMADIELTNEDVIFIPKTPIATASTIFQEYIRSFVNTNISYNLRD